jgi:hypothetical protein
MLRDAKLTTAPHRTIEAVEWPGRPGQAAQDAIARRAACNRTRNRLPDLHSLPKVFHTHKKARAKEHTPMDVWLRLLVDNVDRAVVHVAADRLDTVLDVTAGHTAGGSRLCQRSSASTPRRSLLGTPGSEDADGPTDKGGDGEGEAAAASVDEDAQSPPPPQLKSQKKAAPRGPLALRNSLLDGEIAEDVVVVAGNEGHPTRAITIYPAPLSFEPVTPGNIRKYQLDKKFGEWHTSFHIGATPLDLEKATYPQLAKPAPPAYVAEFNNGAFVTGGNVVTCSRGWTTGACMWDFRVYGPHNAGDAMPVTHVHPRIVALCDYWCKGYFHFTHEHLPRLALVHHLLVADPTMKVTVPKSSGYIKQYLIDVLGYREDQLISVASTYYASQAAFYPQPQRCGSIFTQTLMMLRRIVFERLGHLPHTVCSGKPSATGAVALPRVLWAERKKLSRMPRNYDDVRAEVEATLGGRVAFSDTAGLNVVEQIKAFNAADVVIGPHGANIANAMWMRHGSYLVEFVSYKYANMCYYGTAARMGVIFGAVFHGASKHGHYNSTAAEVIQHIEEMLRTRPSCAVAA